MMPTLPLSGSTTNDESELMFTKILVANRGEIAVRVMRTARAMGIRTVAVYTEPDADSLHARLADEAIGLGSDAARDDYLDIAAVVSAALRSGSEAVHPGYGFLAENAEFAQAVEDAGLVFVGPSPEAIRAMGEKVAARAAAVAAGVPLAPGSTKAVPDAATVARFGADHGYPLLIKAAYGGGGRGMRQVPDEASVAEAFAAAVREATGAFGNGSVYVERYLPDARHVEVQILGDVHGAIVALGDRDCSVQRRHQKLIEEAPAPGLSDTTRAAMADAAVRLARHVGYTGAGTVEFLLDGENFYFLEMNTRIQVEHPVTELVTGIDIVAEQLRVAAGEPLSAQASSATTTGVAIEARINAEAFEGGVFRPSPGLIDLLVAPQSDDLRWDAGYQSGDRVLPNYDSLVGKLIAWAPDRQRAIDGLVAGLARLRIDGVPSTASAIVQIVQTADFQEAKINTNWLENSVVLADVGNDARRSEVDVLGRYYRIPFFAEGLPSSTVTAAPAERVEPSDARARTTRRRSRTGVLDGVVTAPMQGTIISVNVAAGQQVSAGEQLFVLEAMKMENPIAAPHDGTIADVPVALGDAVAAGTSLATYVKES